LKLPAFQYESPVTLTEAVRMLADGAGNAKALAGGQSFIPVLAFRLASPAVIVDLRRVPGLDRIDIDADGVRVGAKVRWRDIERDARLDDTHPLLAAAIEHVAHYQIRNRGTVGGSLAHADPAAEMPGVAIACDAEIHIQGARGARTARAVDFFTGPLSTTLAHDELIVEVRLPLWKPGRRWAFEEFALRRGDFALAGIAAWYDCDAAGRASDAHIGVIGACSKPHRLPHAEAALNGHVVDELAIAAAARAAADDLDPPNDLHAGADYRRSLACTLLERALRRAVARA
jgi:carbon-monoxide dehydrogenase medium subunit